MNLNDLIKSKKLHDEKSNLFYQIQPNNKEVNIDTGYKCLDINRARMELNLNSKIINTSFNQALDSAEGTEIFTVWEKGDTIQWKTIVRNLKDSWQQDNKYINAPLGAGFEVGNTITWVRLNMKWLIIWQDYNKEDYFRGEIQRASHLLRWKNEYGKIQEQWAAVLGPVETKAKYEQTRGNVISGRQNDTVEIWIGANGEKQIDSLNRFSKIKIGGRTWRIHVIDDISNPDIVRINCIEDFNNSDADDDIWLIPNGKVDFAENETKPEINLVRIVGDYQIPERILSVFYAINDKTEKRLTGKWIVNSVNGKPFKLSELENGELEISRAVIGDTLNIKFETEDGISNEISVKVVSMFS